MGENNKNVLRLVSRQTTGCFFQIGIISTFYLIDFSSLAWWRIFFHLGFFWNLFKVISKLDMARPMAPRLDPDDHTYEKKRFEERVDQGKHSSLQDRVEEHHEAHHFGHTDTQGMMRHVLDCLGALRVRAPHDDRVSPALRAVFKGACSVFLDQIARGQDETFDDLSGRRYMMDSFPDASKKKDGRGWLPLHWAATVDETEEEHIDALARERPLAARTFHTSGGASSSVDLAHQKGEHNLLPFHLIVSSRHPSLSNVKRVHSLYPDAVFLHDSNGWLPIHWCSRNCLNIEVLQFLLDCYLDSVTEVTDDGQLPFLLSMGNKRWAVSELLLSVNPDAIDSIDNAGNTALHYAARFCNPDSAKVIISRKPEFLLTKNFAGELPLHQIFSHILRDESNSEKDRSRARWKQLEILRIMLEECPETVSHRDNAGDLPLHLAINLDASIEVIEAIYNVYPTAALLPDNKGNLPVHFASDPQVQSLLFGTSAQLKGVGVTSSFSKFATGGK